MNFAAKHPSVNGRHSLLCRPYAERFIQCAGLAIGLLASATVALAGTSEKSLMVAVTQQQKASYSELPGFVSKTGLGVRIASISSSGASNIWFKVTSTNATYSKAIGTLEGWTCPAGSDPNNPATSGCTTTAFTCTPDANPATVRCELGPLASQASLQFLMPYIVAEGSKDSTIDYLWSIANGQGTANNQPSDSQFSQKTLVKTPVSLRLSTNTKSTVNTLLLADESLTSNLLDNDAISTVKLPNYKPAPVFLEQTETPNTSVNVDRCAAYSTKCFTTKLTIADIGGTTTKFTGCSANDGYYCGRGLKVVLTRAYDTLTNPKSQWDINQAVLYYVSDATPSVRTPILNCGVAPATEVNCIVTRSVEGTGSAKRWVFTLAASENGFREF
jgi:hypothetical protein